MPLLPESSAISRCEAVGTHRLPDFLSALQTLDVNPGRDSSDVQGSLLERNGVLTAQRLGNVSHSFVKLREFDTRRRLFGTVIEGIILR
jgi:hypothetical protein